MMNAAIWECIQRGKPDLDQDDWGLWAGRMEQGLFLVDTCFPPPERESGKFENRTGAL